MTKALSFYSDELSYKVSQMFCFRKQCLKNKTFESPQTKVRLSRKVRLKLLIKKKKKPKFELMNE